ncbi:hypothetical protein D3C73_1284740 [compost metagenome]
MANAMAPRLASMLASRPKFTSATRMAITKISSIDQRPMNSIKRYIHIRWRAESGWWRCTENSNSAIPTSLNVGTMMLAINTTAAIGIMPC